METNIFEIEHTDTFSGEANYSWVTRKLVNVETKASRASKAEQTAIMRAAKEALGISGVRGVTARESCDAFEFRPYGVCQIVFVRWHDCPAGCERCAELLSPLRQARYLEAVEHYTGKLKFFSPGLCSDCEECTPERLSREEFEAATESAGDEGHFSWRPCEGCGSSLGGTRYAAHGFKRCRVSHRRSIVHLDICSDCLFYHANGDVPEDWRASPKD